MFEAGRASGAKSGRRWLDRDAAFGALIVAAAIVYLSLYPFRWRHGLPPFSAVEELLRNWRRWPESGGDFLSNILLYIPWGFFAIRSLRRGPPPARLVAAVALGTALSAAMELSQFYIAYRYTDMRDVYANALGSLIGAVAGAMLGGRWHIPGLGQIQRQPFPALLLAVYLGARLYPYVPVVDWDKYVWALRPLFDFALPSPSELFFRTMVWFAVGHLLERIFGLRSAVGAFVMVAAMVFGGHILIVGQRLSPADVMAAALALLLFVSLWRLTPKRNAALALLFAAAVAIERLEPFRFSAFPHPFDWVPFVPLLHSPIEIGLVATLVKLFLYGALIWLLIEAGLRLWRAVFAVALLLLLCGVLDMYLPMRTAGISDATMALMIGLLLQLLESARAQPQPA